MAICRTGSQCRGLQIYFQFVVLKMCRTIGSLGLQIYFQSVVLEMKNRVVGAIVGSQCRAIWRAGSQFRGCNSTFDLVTTFGALVMRNRVVWLCMESA